MFTKSKDYNPNYLAKIIEITNLRNHNDSKVHSLKCTTVDGNNVIVGKDTSIGDVCIYFPIECQIQDWFLKQNNLYRDSTLNSQTDKKGLFETNGRVKCQTLRGERSMGFIIPANSLTNSNVFLHLNTEFDTFEGKLICKKYIPRGLSQQGSGKQRNRKAVKHSKIIDEQFRFHINTPQLGKNLAHIKGEDLISITRKVHGTSGISSYVLCKKKLNLIQRIHRFFKVKINDEVYDYIYSSRKVIKNDAIDPSGFYSHDIWFEAHRVLAGTLQKGMTFYYEIIGYLPDGKMIQKDYDYGFERPRSNEEFEYGKHFGIQIYRITTTNIDGRVIEFSAKQVQNFCKENGLIAVEELYYGKASNYLPFPTISEEDFQNQFLQQLTNELVDGKCPICKHNVPNEGVIIRKDNTNYLTVYKCKSFEFLKKESKELDKGEENIEDKL